MKRRWVIVCCVVSLMIGAGAATWACMYFNSLIWYAQYESSTNANIVTKVAVLEKLRAGKIADAVAFQENLLDGDIIGASILLREGHKLSENAVKSLILERRVRATSGYDPGFQVTRDAIREVFEQLPKD